MTKILSTLDVIFESCKISFLIIFTALFVLTGCEDDKEEELSKSSNNAHIENQAKIYDLRYRGLSSRWLEAEYAIRENELDYAAEQIEYIYQKTGNINASKKLLMIYLQKGDYSKFSELSAKLAANMSVSTLKESNYEEGLLPYNLVVVIANSLNAAKKGNYDNAEYYLKNAPSNSVASITIPMLQAWNYAGMKNTDAAIDKLNLDSPLGAYHGYISYLKGLVYNYSGEHDNAKKQFANLIKSNNSNKRMMRQIIGYLAQEKIMSQNIEQNTNKGEEQGYALNNVNLEEQGSNQGYSITPLVKDVSQGYSEALYLVASILAQENALEEAEIFLHLAVYAAGNNNPDAQLMLAQILEREERFEQARKIYEEMKNNPDAHFRQKASLSLVENIYDSGNRDEAMKLLENLIEENSKSQDKNDPSNYKPLLQKADILRTEKKYLQAAEIYSEALDSLKDLQANHWAILYARGICYEKAGQWQLAEKDFFKALELYPEQPDVMNYLGYSWLEKDIRYDDAYDMIAKAVEKRPNDPHIIDSYGWAYYLSGNYERAIAYLERAVEIMPYDPVVNDHLGDAYWANGRKNEAKFQWNRALSFKPDEELSETIRQKLYGIHSLVMNNEVKNASKGSEEQAYNRKK